MPLGDEIIALLPKKPKFLERKPIIERIRDKLHLFVEILLSGMIAKKLVLINF